MFIKDLGELQGPVLVFGGIYSNIHALNALLDAAQVHDIKPANMICTGDVVAYCSEAKQVVDRMRELDIPTVQGNCEVQLAQDADDCGCGFEEGSTCSLLSRSWYAHAKSTLNAEDKRWMGALPSRLVFTHHGKRYGVVHGGATDISKFIWPVTDVVEIKREINVLEGEVGSIDVALSGHSGIPMQAKSNDHFWTNSGAIGMPANNGRRHTSYVILQGDDVEFHSLEYDAQGAHDAMVQAGLAQGYHEALLTGYWPSEETLPQIMRK
jgi:predicted phosphodiesterase